MRKACTFAAILLGMAASLICAADTVVLKDGARFAGEATVAPEEVAIRSSTGVLTFPAWRVERVEKETKTTEPSGERPSAQAPRRPAGPLRKTVSARVEGVAPRKALDRRIAVDFEGARLAEVLRYVGEVAGIPIVTGPAAKMETDPIHLRVSDAPVRTILDVVLDPRGLGYGIRPGGILYVDAKPAVEKLEFRLYPVTDLLLSTADTAPGGRAGARPDRGEEAGVLAPQFAPGPAPAPQRAAPAGAQNEMERRTESLVGILNYCCGRGRWVRFAPAAGEGTPLERVAVAP